jgi:hypothetical protein
MKTITRAKLLTGLLAGATALPFAGAAQAANSVRRVRFPRGTTGTILHGRVRGYDVVDYLVGVRAGQQMTVSLRSDNGQNYFNVSAPGGGDAFFHGDAEGGDAQFTTQRSGDYVVRVYLMRAAARRGEAGNFTLEISIQ